jgi:hypothetical protein
MTSRYSANGCGHQILTKLSAGPAFAGELAELARTKRDGYFIIGALSRDGFIVVTKAGYEITTSGQAKHAELEASSGLPKARVYGARAGA